MRLSPIRRTLLVSLPLGILMGASGALAGVSLLDEADEHIDKAVLALKKADDPKQFGEYGGHRKKALDSLDDAKRQVKKAKDYIGGHPEKPPGTPSASPPTPKPVPTSSGGPKKPPSPPPPPKK